MSLGKIQRKMAGNEGPRDTMRNATPWPSATYHRHQKIDNERQCAPHCADGTCPRRGHRASPTRRLRRRPSPATPRRRCRHRPRGQALSPSPPPQHWALRRRRRPHGRLPASIPRFRFRPCAAVSNRNVDPGTGQRHRTLCSRVRRMKHSPRSPLSPHARDAPRVQAAPFREPQRAPRRIRQRAG